MARRRRYPHWSQAELDDLRELHDAGEIQTAQQALMRKIVRANRPWWLRWMWWR